MNDTPMPDDRRLSDEDAAALARLADGRLPAGDADALRARVAATPALAAAAARQDQALVVLRAAAAERAPLALRERLTAAPAARRAPRWRLPALLGGAAAVAAAVIIALVVAGGGAPQISDVAEAAAVGPTLPAPGPSATEPKLLDAEVDGVAFPAWAKKFGWKAVGAAEREVDGRTTRTVYYENPKGRRAAYTIVSGSALEVPEGARTVRVAGTDLSVFTENGRPVVTWERGGRTCVLTADGVPTGKVLDLAAWKGKGSIPF
jgi:hypothetical protein